MPSSKERFQLFFLFCAISSLCWDDSWENASLQLSFAQPPTSHVAHYQDNQPKAFSIGHLIPASIPQLSMQVRTFYPQIGIHVRTASLHFEMAHVFHSSCIRQAADSICQAIVLTAFLSRGLESCTRIRHCPGIRPEWPRVVRATRRPLR